MTIKYWAIQAWDRKVQMICGNDITSEAGVQLLGIKLDSAWAAIELTKEQYDRNLAEVR